MKTFLTAAIAGVALVLTPACASTHYSYRATEPTALTPRGISGVTYEIGSPQGLVRMAAIGMRRLPAFSSRPVFVMRYYIENKSGVDWKIEPASQRIGFDGEAKALPPLASTLESSKKVFEAKTGKTQVFDLVYDSAGGEPRKFVLGWSIEAAGKTQTGLAPFEKWEIPPGSLEGNYVGQEIEVNLLPGAGGMYRNVH